MKITGTFLDEISHDIPSANWGQREWAEDFDAMSAIGIDTVILIRCGYKDKATFNSKVLNSHSYMRPVYEDLVNLFLEQSERCGMDFYFGLYDSGQFWESGQFDMELGINCFLGEEVVEKYGNRKAFKGWYLSHELSRFDEKVMVSYRKLCQHIRKLKNVPILMSPYIRGRKQFEAPITPELHREEWDNIFKCLEGCLDYVAFQDGQVDFSELPVYQKINVELAAKYGLESWSNIESFERDMPIKFLPIEWSNMRYKIESALAAGMKKLITFEFSHFMSPNSVYPAARNLYRRYKQWLENENLQPELNCI